MRQAAAENLGHFGHNGRAAVPYLIEALKDVDSSVRSRAAEALGEIGDRSAVPHLIEVLKDKYTQQIAAKAIKKLEGKE